MVSSYSTDSSHQAVPSVPENPIPLAEPKEQRRSLTRTPTEDEDDDALAAVLDILGMGVVQEPSDGTAATESDSTSVGNGENAPEAKDDSAADDTETAATAEAPVSSASSSPPPAVTPQAILAFGRGLCTELELEQAENCESMVKEINKDVHNAIGKSVCVH